jgi:hypothetical protein
MSRSMAEPKIKVFNTPLEVGFRALVILRQFSGKSLDIEQLMYLDYLSQNTNDVGGPESLSAPIPNRGVQVYARKELLHKGIVVLLSKELINFENNQTGFSYSINEAGEKFLELFHTKYYHDLAERSAWLTEKFGDMNLMEMRAFMNDNISNWGGEFI